ncbi:MAG: hypothetical protein EOP87_01425 [Verrucomicrobiaceae bacterium]|nr:MAG: hypothetical protein EOP87_01425 [Verrucomicrobiaceae bacterium]
MKISNRTAKALGRREALHNALRHIEAQDFFPRVSDGAHERVSMFNADLATESTFSQPLTDYAVGFSDDTDLDRELEFFAPGVEVAPRFDYATFESAEEFLSDGDDDERPIKADFKEVEYVQGEVSAATKNRGLQITLDVDKIRGSSDWEEHYTQKLVRRIKRNSLRRAILLLAAAGVNTAKTWDVTAGKDPDQDIASELILAANLTGLKPRKVGYGDTAWAKRVLSHRAQDNAGGYASAGLTPEQLAAFLAVDEVLRSNGRYTSSASAKAEMLGNLVLMFTAESGVDTEDASNIKRFWSNGDASEGGGKIQVYSQRVSSKRHIIAVGHYELIAITSTVGVRKFTIS